MIAWQVSGVDARRWRIRRASLWRPPVSVRRSTVEIPGRHGVAQTNRPPVFGEPTVSLVFSLLGGQEHLEAAANELIGTLSAPELTVTRRSADLTTTARAELVSVGMDRFVAATTARLTAVLGIPGVFLRGQNATSDLGAVAHGDVRDVPVLSGSTAPVTDAIVRVRGPLTMVRVVDVATGTGLEWSGSISDAQYLFLHTATLVARRGSSGQWDSGGTLVTAGLDYPPAGPLQLWPVMQGGDPADRRARLRVEGSGFGTTTAVAVRAAPAYL